MLLVIIGESGCGKTSLANYMSEHCGYEKVVTCTTRPIRNGEKDGVDYYFITDSEFYRILETNGFVESATYNSWHYGTLRSTINSKDFKNKVVILTPSGYRQLKKEYKGKMHSIYLCVPRRDRLIQLLKRGDNIEEAYRRSLSDLGQYDGVGNEVDVVLHNDGYLFSVEEIASEIIKNL